MFVLVLVAASACIPGRSSRPNPQVDPYRVTRDELEASRFDNLYDALSQLRPGWFQRHSRSGSEVGILVYLDDQLVGSGATLRRFATRAVVEVRYLAPTEAQVRYGQSNYGRAAITLQSAH